MDVEAGQMSAGPSESQEWTTGGTTPASPTKMRAHSLTERQMKNETKEKKGKRKGKKKEKHCRSQQRDVVCDSLSDEGSTLVSYVYDNDADPDYNETELTETQMCPTPSITVELLACHEKHSLSRGNGAMSRAGTECVRGASSRSAEIRGRAATDVGL